MMQDQDIPQDLYLNFNQMCELRERYELWVTAGMPRGDEELFPIFASLNCLPHVVPVWSCAGHQSRDRSYIMFGCNELGLIQLMQLLASTRADLASDTHTRPYRLGLNLMANIWPCGTTPIEERTTYPTTILEYHYSTIDERDAYLRALTARLELLSQIVHRI